MFGFLKDKIKSAVARFTKEVDSEDIIDNNAAGIKPAEYDADSASELRPAEDLEQGQRQETPDEPSPAKKAQMIEPDKSLKDSKETSKAETHETKPKEDDTQRKGFFSRIKDKLIGERRETEPASGKIDVLPDAKPEELSLPLPEIAAEPKPREPEAPSEGTDKSLGVGKARKDEQKNILRDRQPRFDKKQDSEVLSKPREGTCADEAMQISEPAILESFEGEQAKPRKAAPDKIILEADVKPDKARRGMAKPEITKPEMIKKDVAQAKEILPVTSDEPALQKERGPDTEKSRGFFGRISDSITKRGISEEKFEEIFQDLEIGLLENNVALEVVDKIKADLKEELVNKKVRIGKAGVEISKALRLSIEGLFNVESVTLLEEARKKKPYVIAFVGVNGSGKTTTIAKMAALLKTYGLTSVVAAGDTFRAAAIQQLQEHADNLGIRLIKHDYGSDPAAVAFDAVKYAAAKGIDVVLIDTAGRLHSNTNLMDEMKKIMRVAKPDLKIFIGEAITGNDCVEQAREFNEAIGIDGIILAKSDVDEKGGAMISVSYVTQKPILFLGTGQEYDKLVPFDPRIVTEGIGL